MKKKIKILCTIGPSSYNQRVLSNLKKKIDFFRLNMSHLSIVNLNKKIKLLKKLGINNKICIDTEGAQIRTGKVKKSFLKKNIIVTFYNTSQKPKKKVFYLYPPINFNKIKLKTKFLIGFDDLELQVIKKDKHHIKAKVINSGLIDSNKGVHFKQIIKMDGITNKDILSKMIIDVINKKVDFNKNKKKSLFANKLIDKIKNEF